MKKKSITVFVPNRLHATCMDMRTFDLGKCGGGGIGIAISHYLKLTVSISDTDIDIIDAPNELVICRFLQRFRETTNCEVRFRIRIDGNVLSHIGFGSTGSVVICVLYGIRRLLDLSVETGDLIEFFLNNICEEHDGKLTTCFETGVGPWTNLMGGITIVDNAGQLCKSMMIPDCFSALIVYPKVLKKISIDEEEMLLNSYGKMYDQIDCAAKTLLFDQLSNTDFNDYKGACRGLEIIKQFQKLGSKRAEIEFSNRIYNGLISKYSDIGLKYNVLAHGLSSIGPTYFYIDENPKIRKMHSEYINDKNSIVGIYSITRGLYSIFDSEE